ncbi:MAG: peptide deformylase [Nocardioidaceae bacterium]
MTGRLHAAWSAIHGSSCPRVEIGRCKTATRAACRSRERSSTCPRPDFSRVEGVDQTGRSVAYEGTGLLARCLHHESDHLEGIVFGDRLATRVRKKLWKEASKVAQDYPPGWPAHQAD